MIPNYFIKIEKIPMTANGKVDRRALLDMKGQQIESGIQYITPRNPLEMTIAEVWKEVLGLQEVGIHNNFFDLGGNSIDIMKVNGKLEKLLDRQVSVMTLFKYPTIIALAQHLQNNDEPAETAQETVKEERKETIKKGRDRLRKRLEKR